MKIPLNILIHASNKLKLKEVETVTVSVIKVVESKLNLPLALLKFQNQLNISYD